MQRWPAINIDVDVDEQNQISLPCQRSRFDRIEYGHTGRLCRDTTVTLPEAGNSIAQEASYHWLLRHSTEMHLLKRHRALVAAD